MKRELFLHFAFWFSFFILIVIAKGHFTLSFWPFWAGGVIGTFLPDLDHIIYVAAKSIKKSKCKSQKYKSKVKIFSDKFMKR